VLTLTAAGGSSDTDDQSHPYTQLRSSDSAWRQRDSDIDLGLPSTFSQQTFMTVVTLWMTFINLYVLFSLCSHLYNTLFYLCLFIVVYLDQLLTIALARNRLYNCINE